MDQLSKAEALKTLMDAYGIAVRAGLITPNLEDERAMRKVFGLPEPSPAVIAEWERTKGVRAPITISNGSIAVDKAASNQSDPNQDPAQ